MSYKQIDIEEWIKRVQHDPQQYLERQVTEIILSAVGAMSPYGEKLFLKGGILMGIVYSSTRQTADIDFTAGFNAQKGIEEELKSQLDTNLQRFSTRLGYPNIVCCVQTIKPQPRKKDFEQFSAPQLQLKIAYAQRDTSEHQRLKQGKCSNVIKLELSFNEPVSDIEIVKMSDSVSLSAYSIIDIIAEKFRALIQQPKRNRTRRQDLYDINFLINNYPLSYEDKDNILKTLLKKAYKREIYPNIDSLTNEDVKSYTAAEWESLSLEVEDLPPFEDTYKDVEAFYRSLPWKNY